MYRINVHSTGKHHNVVVGPRYCLTKKTAKHLINIYLNSDCDITVEKFIRIYHDVFCWSYDNNDSVLEYYYNKYYEIEEEE